MEIKDLYFGTINSLMGSLPEQDVYGLHVANHQFMQALLRYGRFAGYHFFVSNELVKSFETMLKRSFGKEPNYPKIKIVPFSSIKESLQRYKYLVFHHGDPGFSNYFFVRQELGLQNFPISCFVHTVSASQMPVWMMHLVIANTKPYDVMFCPTRSLSTALNNIFQQVKTVLNTPDNFHGELCNIPFGIDLERFKPYDRDRTRRKLHLPRQAVILGYIGRITAWNKMDLLPFLKVFQLLLKKLGRKDIYLYIIGREQQKDYLKLLKKAARELGIQKRLKFITRHKNAQIPEYYAALDIFISPCDHVQETFGITPVEAMASGVPVVVSDWDGYKETVKDGETGLRIPTYWHGCANSVKDTVLLDGIRKAYMQLGQSVAVDVDKYVEALAKLVEDGQLRQEMGRKARSWTEEKFSWEKIIPQYEAVWQEKYEQAQKDTSRTKKSAFYSMPYFDLFRHYPSGLLTLESKVQATEQGQALRSSKEPIDIHHELKGKIFNDEVKKIAVLAAPVITLGELLQKMRGVYNDIQEDELMQHVLWMLKYNFLSMR